MSDTRQTSHRCGNILRSARPIVRTRAERRAFAVMPAGEMLGAPAKFSMAQFVVKKGIRHGTTS
jgi:hypothetical protein